MRLSAIFFLLFFSAVATAQNLVPFGGSRPSDTAFADRALKVNGIIKASPRGILLPPAPGTSGPAITITNQGGKLSPVDAALSARSTIDSSLVIGPFLYDFETYMRYFKGIPNATGSITAGKVEVFDVVDIPGRINDDNSSISSVIQVLDVGEEGYRYGRLDRMMSSNRSATLTTGTGGAVEIVAGSGVGASFAASDSGHTQRDTRGNVGVHLSVVGGLPWQFGGQIRGVTGVVAESMSDSFSRGFVSIQGQSFNRYFSDRIHIGFSAIGNWGNLPTTGICIGAQFLGDDGVDIGIYTDTDSNYIENLTAPKLNIPNLPEHADNASAISAGLVPGDLYRTGDLLKIVH